MARGSPLNGSTKLVYLLLSAAATVLLGLLWMHLATVNQHGQDLVAVQASIASLDYRMGANERAIEVLSQEQRVHLQRLADLQERLALAQQQLQGLSLRLTTTNRHLLLLSQRLDGKTILDGGLYNEAQ